jgi:hypothetical protein
MKFSKVKNLEDVTQLDEVGDGQATTNIFIMYPRTREIVTFANMLEVIQPYRYEKLQKMTKDGLVYR